jgi:hypothetical protein
MRVWPCARHAGDGDGDGGGARASGASPAERLRCRGVHVRQGLCRGPCGGDRDMNDPGQWVAPGRSPRLLACGRASSSSVTRATRNRSDPRRYRDANSIHLLISVSLTVCSMGFVLQWRWESVVLGSGFLFFLLVTRFIVSAGVIAPIFLYYGADLTHLFPTAWSVLARDEEFKSLLISPLK